MNRHVLTLVALEGLNGAVVDDVAEGLHRAGAKVGEASWLAPGVAYDLFFDGADPGTVTGRVRAAIGGAAVDLAAQPVAGRRKRLLVADMESTVIRNEMLDELADFAGVRSRVEEITGRAMRGELDFAAAVRERVALLEGLPADVIERALERVEVDPGAAVLVATMKADGAFAALVSGGFDVFAEPIAHCLGFDAWRANRLEISGGRLTGRAGEPILGRDAKVWALEDYCSWLGAEPRQAAAVGDGANDLPLLGAAGLGVAYHAKPAVVAAARFGVRHGDLRTLLYYQGYLQTELVETA